MKNCSNLGQFVTSHSSVRFWTRPTPGTIVMALPIKHDKLVKDEEFYLNVLKEMGLLVMPGSTFPEVGRTLGLPTRQKS